MTFSYILRDKDDKQITSNTTSNMFIDEASFRSYIRKDAKRFYENAHYCEYYEINVRNTRMKTIALF